MTDDKLVTYPKTSPFIAKPKPRLDTRPSKTMNFCEAMQRILRGKRITKSNWGKGWFAYLYKEEATLALRDPDGDNHSWVISEGDIIGKDYMEI